jgi:hypothetical protein
MLLDWQFLVVEARIRVKVCCSNVSSSPVAIDGGKKEEEKKKKKKKRKKRIERKNRSKQAIPT